MLVERLALGNYDWVLEDWSLKCRFGAGGPGRESRVAGRSWSKEDPSDLFGG